MSNDDNGASNKAPTELITTTPMVEIAAQRESRKRLRNRIRRNKKK